MCLRKEFKMGVVLMIHAAKIMSLGVLLLILLSALNPIFKVGWLKKIVGLCMVAYLVAMLVLK